ncbi:uncharacterized protein LOC109852899 [Pseudomyrmex gracilis]|uniref:uncharacterized protein LOC109852899 n=1 Tax=Pseudomyrmex gracilis TaxID=219809 RepID=UPI00099499B3|nr:uncharacterized protein LOC109852899 [Pseudomyrmex gracilis]
MASSKGKARDRAEKKRIAERKPRANVRSRGKSTRRKRVDTPRRQLHDSVSIPQLVYELLTIDKYNQDAKRFQSPARFGTPHRTVQKYHDRQRFHCDSTAAGHRDITESVQVPDYVMESGPTSVESLTEPMDANSSAPTSSANSSVSNISMEPTANTLDNARELFGKKSLVQLINGYIKAGIDEGKRQAKKYIRKALSFGVRLGYLIPTDSQGNVLRVCPTLDTGSWRSKRAESRERRRVARRGGTNPTTIDDRKAMRRGIPRDKPRPDDEDNGQTTSKRGRWHSANSPVRNSNLRETAPRKTSERDKSKTVARKSKLDVNINKRRQQRKRGGMVRKPIRRRREVLSPKLNVENYREPVGESHNDANDEDRDRHKSNEDNYRPAVENWKSTTLNRAEDESRTERRKTETNVDDETERRNADEKHGEEETNCVERNASDTIGEINDA